MPKLTFSAWMKKVDASVSASLGCSVYDLEDFSGRDMYDRLRYLYDAGETPKEAAWEAVVNSAAFAEMLDL